MDDIIFNTAMPMTTVPTTPMAHPTLRKASGMAKQPPPMVALIKCTIASLFLPSDTRGRDINDKKRYSNKKKCRNHSAGFAWG